MNCRDLSQSPRALPGRIQAAVLGFCLLAHAGPAAGSRSPLDAAIALFEARKFAEAQTALTALTAAEPDNAAACHYLGLAILRRNVADSLAEAVTWLEKATRLDPENADYLADYGGASLRLADRTRSISAATKGRAAMEKSLTINPANLDAREGLFQFYSRAPWPLGSSAKAAAHLEEIRKLNPARATALAVVAKTNARDYDAAFRLCEEVLAAQPNDYSALYQFGRTADISGRNLERGLACLQHCLEAEPPGPASASHSNVWFRIGAIEEKLGHRERAREAYEAALRLDPANRPAREARARLP